jgi:hypothetical protein
MPKLLMDRAVEGHNLNMTHDFRTHLDQIQFVEVANGPL